MLPQILYLIWCFRSKAEHIPTEFPNTLELSGIGPNQI